LSIDKEKVMKHIATIILFALCATKMFAQRAEIVEIQLLLPPETVIDFGTDDKNIAIVAVHYQRNASTHTTEELLLDSLLVNAIANGIKERLGNSPIFEDFDIPIYNLYSDTTMIGSGMPKEELDAISEQSGAKIVAAIEYVYLKSDTNKIWEIVSFYVTINTYDVQTGANVKRYTRKNYIRFFKDYDEIKFYLAKPDSDGLRRRRAKAIGRDYAKRIAPTWEIAKRMIFCDRKNSNFKKAYKSAIEEQDWETAVEYWTDALSDEKIKDLKKAQAMYNLALACEMLENFDLSLKWLEKAKDLKTKINNSVEEYEIVLKLRIKDKEKLDEIFNKNKF